MVSPPSTLHSQLSRGGSGHRGLVLRGSQSEGGFALLITITMLAFVVVLLIGLAAYTRVETAVAGNTQRQAQARENALLAFNVALGQLQRHAGSDTRATATAHNFGANDGTRLWTGVWAANPTDDSDGNPSTPETWLVSGNELSQPDPNPDAPAGTTIPVPLAITPAVPGNRTVDLVGRNSTGTTTRTSYVVAPLIDVTATGIPGAPPAANTAIGRYAWWVGDQGVKAPVAVPDTSDTITFAPYDTAEMRGRIRQQLALGAGAADASGNPVFEPRDSNNTNLVAGQKITAASQFAFLRNSSNAQLGLLRAQQNIQNWSPNNYAVLANTKLGGLRQDLSLAPSFLGGAFAAWANFPAYMEQPVATVSGTEGEESSSTPTISPAYGTEPLRRRYQMTPHLLEPDIGGSHQVGPVLTYFLLTFNVRTEGGLAGILPLEVRARWMVSLWNPYTSSLVPENLRIEVSGLPTSVTVVNENPTRAGPVANFSLRDPSLYDSAPKFSLPWDSTDAAGGTPDEDRQSWLPGRVYTWRSIEDSNSSGGVPSDGFAGKFYTRSFTATGETNQGIQRQAPGGATVDGDDICHLEVSGSDQLTVTLYAVRPDGEVRLGRFLSPNFVDGFVTNPQAISEPGYQFSYVFRLAESLDTPDAPGTWLTSAGRDVRRRTVPAEVFIVGENGNDPAQYENFVTISKPDRLLDRESSNRSYNQDVPVFELPRGPLLSMGALQHFRLVAQRPFMIGNSWGAAFELNGMRTAELFDRFFFSGLIDGLTPATTSTGDLLLPSPLLKPLRKPDATRVTIEDVRALTPPAGSTNPGGDGSGAPAAHSSKFFLQGGAFNLNSANVTAWAAVLRGVRFPAPQSFRYLDVSDSTGTAADADTATVQSTDAQFFRFSQSAQETYKAEADQAGDSGTTSPANTHLFRRGMRTLTAAQVSALANRIKEKIDAKHTAEGPFRSLDEFLSPSALFAGSDPDGNPGASRSLLEAAIADAGINDEIAEFSSQWLTQGDIMTALAPVLFPRSDTFVIRSYGEVVNPATNATEGRAWCEAIVQRVPEYLESKDNVDDPSGDYAETSPAELTSAINRIHGRRFKVVSFRWLTRADI